MGVKVDRGGSMFSTCYARLISVFSGLKLQAVISSKIDKDDCLKWGEEVSNADYFKDMISVHLIHERMIDESEFILGDLYCSIIKSLTISFVSRLELFLKDSMRLCMMRNYSLLKKGLYEYKITIEPLDIVEYNDIDKMRLKYINIISNKVSSGELWSEKFKKYVKFLSLSNNLQGEDINHRIDSIWKMRNDISHANSNIMTFEHDGNTYRYNTNINSDEYVKFALIFIELVDECEVFFKKVDGLSLEKWKVKDGELLHKV